MIWLKALQALIIPTLMMLAITWTQFSQGSSVEYPLDTKIDIVRFDSKQETIQRSLERHRVGR